MEQYLLLYLGCFIVFLLVSIPLCLNKRNEGTNSKNPLISFVSYISLSKKINTELTNVKQKRKQILKEQQKRENSSSIYIKSGLLTPQKSVEIKTPKTTANNMAIQPQKIEPQIELQEQHQKPKNMNKKVDYRQYVAPFLISALVLWGFHFISPLFIKQFLIQEVTIICALVSSAAWLICRILVSLQNFRNKRYSQSTNKTEQTISVNSILSDGSDNASVIKTSQSPKAPKVSKQKSRQATAIPESNNKQNIQIKGNIRQKVPLSASELIKVQAVKSVRNKIQKEVVEPQIQQIEALTKNARTISSNSLSTVNNSSQNSQKSNITSPKVSQLSEMLSGNSQGSNDRNNDKRKQIPKSTLKQNILKPKTKINLKSGTRGAKG